MNNNIITSGDLDNQYYLNWDQELKKIAEQDKNPDYTLDTDSLNIEEGLPELKKEPPIDLDTIISEKDILGKDATADELEDMPSAIFIDE